MNPTLENMTIEELQIYVLSHSSNIEAFHFLVDRLKAKGQRIQYPCPNNPENIAIMQQAIREQVVLKL
jgi:hypothetical protein